MDTNDTIAIAGAIITSLVTIVSAIMYQRSFHIVDAAAETDGNYPKKKAITITKENKLEFSPEFSITFGKVFFGCAIFIVACNIVWELSPDEKYFSPRLVDAHGVINSINIFLTLLLLAVVVKARFVRSLYLYAFILCIIAFSLAVYFY